MSDNLILEVKYGYRHGAWFVALDGHSLPDIDAAEVLRLATSASPNHAAMVRQQIREDAAHKRDYAARAIDEVDNARARAGDAAVAAEAARLLAATLAPGDEEA